MPEINHVVGPEEAGRTVKSIALKEMGLSQRLFSSLKFSGGLLLDGERTYAAVRLRPGQRLTAVWRESPAAPPAPFALPLCVPWQDGHYWVIDKSAPLPTLSSARQRGPSLENALYSFLGCPEGFVFRPVNRLDKGTSGLMAVARDGHAQQLLQRRLHTGEFTREYWAVCRGKLPEAEGKIDLPIGRIGEGPKRQISRDGLRAVTHYRRMGEAGGLTLARLRLETGRTHQIRVHLAALGCPVLGDYLYGEPHPALPGRFALHSCALSFVHPFTGEEIRVESPLPGELHALLGNMNIP